MTKKKDTTPEFEDDDVLAEDAELGVNAVLDSIELTEKEKLELEAEAKAEVLAAMKESKKKAFKAAAKKRAKAEHLFRSGQDETGEDVEEVKLELASHPKYIMLDGSVYHSGRTYKKKAATARVLRDIMFRGWQQEAARAGENISLAEQKRKVFGNAGLQFH